MKPVDPRTPSPTSTSSAVARTLHRYRLAIVLACVFGAAFAIGRARPVATPRGAAIDAGTAQTSETPVWGAPDPETARLGADVGRVPAASAAPVAARAEADPRALLREALASDDVAVRIAGIERVTSQTSLAALPELTRFRLERDPAAAPTVIHAVALLGASGEGRSRDEASKVLTQWLAQESKREGVDAVGNVSNLVEALGNVGGSDAALALASALDGGGLPLHVQILAVQKLGELAEPRTRPSVERFAARAAALPKAEDLEEELRMEAINTARETLARL